MIRSRKMISCGVAISGIALIAACGGSNDGGTPTNPSPGGGMNNPATTITITSSGVSPKTLTVPRGSQVTFTNNDSRPHDMESDPHPDHTDCPQLAQVGFLTTGQSKQSSNLNTARTCGYHDHNDDQNNNLKGTIVIQ